MFSPISGKLENPRNSDLEAIMAIHRYKRPKGSRIEQAYVEAFIEPLGVKRDKWGNLHKIILPVGASEDTHANIIWSSHTDTVHTSEGFQRVICDANGMLSLRKGEDSNCLGADDGAGNWLMIEMIKARVPGWYIFHYGEEKGCEGSTKLSQNHPELFKHVQMAVAFDRKGNGDVITKMQGNKVCSDEFADSLIEQLPKGYKKENFGMRTDTALYRSLVAECTNISVGYLDMHQKTERLDTMHLIDLRDHLIKIDVTKLVVKRDPKAVEVTQHGGYNRHAYDTDSYKKSYPRTFRELFRDSPELCSIVMKAGGIDFDVFLSLVIAHQNNHKPIIHHTSMEREVHPYTGWKDPLAKPNPPAETTPEPASESEVIVAPPPSRGGGSSNVVPGPKPATDPQPDGVKY